MKKRMNKVMAIVMCGSLMAGVLSGCGAVKEEASAPQEAETGESAEAAEAPAEENAEQTAGGKSLFLCPKCVGYDYWTSCETGAQEAADALGYDLTFNGPAATDSAQQITMMEDAMTQGIAGLGISANDADAVIDTIATAKEKGIYTVAFDSDSPNSDRDYCVIPESDAAMGEQLAEMIAQEMGGEGKLAFMVASLSAENQVSKFEAAEAYINEKYPDIEIVATLCSDDENEHAYENAQTLLSTYPDLKGILGFAGAEAPQAAAAVGQAIDNGDLEAGQICVTGIGFPSQCREGLKSGVLKQILSWNPQETGKVTVYVLDALLNGKTIEEIEIDGIELRLDGSYVYHGCILLTPDNVDDYNYS